MSSEDVPVFMVWTDKKQTRQHREAIAEDALALLRAFVDRDVHELKFRSVLLSLHAQAVSCPALGTAAEVILCEINAGVPLEHNDPLSHALERVIAAAIDIVATNGE